MQNLAVALAFIACVGHGRRARIALDQVSVPKSPVKLKTVQQAAGQSLVDEANQSRRLVKAFLALCPGCNPRAAFNAVGLRALFTVRSLEVPALATASNSRHSHPAGVAAAATPRIVRNTSFTGMVGTPDGFRTNQGHRLPWPRKRRRETSTTPRVMDVARVRTALLRLPMILIAFLLLRQPALASGGLPVSVPAVPLSKPALIGRSVLWACLFFVASLFAGAETAITTLWPWKVKQLAAQEGDKSPFRTLESDITTVLRTVLIGVTFCTIYSTALVTDVAVGLFGSRGVAYATIASTIITLFFGEILPKSLAVAQPEKVARFALPVINMLSIVVKPLSWLTSAGTDVLLGILGADKDKSAETVSKPELRMVVNQAAEVGSVDLYEEDMIEGVLDLQRTQVSSVMTPRVEIEAVSQNTTLTNLLSVALKTKYSRIPVYSEDIDNIVGIVLTRELLGFCNLGDVQEREDVLKIVNSTVLADPHLQHGNVADVMENVEGQFVPESMRAMNALKLMRQSRAHMLFVVDEYGGTSGIITLEDILETLVGEIYDEDDSEEQIDDSTLIVQAEDGTYTIDGMTEIDVVLRRLELEDAVDSKVLEDYSTLSGFLCHEAGQILAVGDVLLLAQWRFEVLLADERKLLSLRASNMSNTEILELPETEMRGDGVEWTGLPVRQ